MTLCLVKNMKLTLFPNHGRSSRKAHMSYQRGKDGNLSQSHILDDPNKYSRVLVQKCDSADNELCLKCNVKVCNKNSSIGNGLINIRRPFEQNHKNIDMTQLYKGKRVLTSDVIDAIRFVCFDETQNKKNIFKKITLAKRIYL